MKSCRAILPIIAVVVAFVFSGCAIRPDLGPPGTIGMQRSRAALHDPFPDNDLGPPVLGGRPRGFDRPRPEVYKDQSNPYARRGAPVQPQYGF